MKLVRHVRGDPGWFVSVCFETNDGLRGGHTPSSFVRDDQRVRSVRGDPGRFCLCSLRDDLTSRLSPRHLAQRTDGTAHDVDCVKVSRHQLHVRVCRCLLSAVRCPVCPLSSVCPSRRVVPFWLKDINNFESFPTALPDSLHWRQPELLRLCSLPLRRYAAIRARSRALPYVQDMSASSGSLKTSTTMTSPSARRSLMRAEDEPITLKKKACRPVCRRRQLVMIERGNPLFVVTKVTSSTKKFSFRESEQIRTLLDRQREQLFADYQAEIRKHEFQADYDRRSIQKLNETIESQKEEIHRACQGDERRRQVQQLLHEQLLAQNRDLREAHEKSLSEMEELKRFHGSTFDTIGRRKLLEDQDTIFELIGKIQELQNEISYMNDLRDFQDAESVRSGHSHVASQLVSFPPHPVPGGMLSRSLGMPSRNDGPPSIWDTHGTSGNVFANPTASSAPCPQQLNPWRVLIYQNQFTHHGEE